MEYDETEMRILDAAARLLIRFGYDKTTLDDVAREAGISRSTLYTRWKKKDALFRALLWHKTVEYADDFIARLEQDHEAATLAGFFRLALTLLNENVFIRTLYAQEMHILGPLLLGENITQLYQWRISSTAAFLEVLQKCGMVCPDIDLQTLAYVLSSLQLGILKMSEVIPREQAPPMDIVIRETIQMLNSYAGVQTASVEEGRAALMEYLRTVRQQLETLQEVIPPKG